MNWNFLCIWWGVFLHIWNVALCPVTSGSNFSVPLALLPNRTVTLFFEFVPPWQESPLYVLLGWRLQKSAVSLTLNMSFSFYPSILRLVSVYFGESFTFSFHHCFGIYNGSFSQHSLYTRLCHFLKWSIQLFEARQQSMVRWAATCRALSFRWGPSMDALAIWACLNHAERMVSSLSIGKVFRDLCSVMTHIASVFSQFQTIYSLSCWMAIPTNQALLLDPPEFPCEHQLRLILAFFHL